MTFRETNRVIREGGDLTHAEFRVLAIVAGIVNEPNDWICDKDPETFEREANMSWVQIRRYLNRLVELGWIEPEHASLGRVQSTYRWLGQPRAECAVDDESDRALNARQPRAERPSERGPSLLEKETETKNPPNPPQTGGESDGFEAFWVLYPKKQRQGDARRAYANAIRHGASDVEILDGLRRNLRDLERLGQFLPNPHKWLRGGRWTDEPSGTAGYVEESFTDDIGFDSPERLLDEADREALRQHREEVAK